MLWNQFCSETWPRVKISIFYCLDKSGLDRTVATSVEELGQFWLHLVLTKDDIHGGLWFLGWQGNRNIPHTIFGIFSAMKNLNIVFIGDNKIISSKGCFATVITKLAYGEQWGTFEIFEDMGSSSIFGETGKSKLSFECRIYGWIVQ